MDTLRIQNSKELKDIEKAKEIVQKKDGYIQDLENINTQLKKLNKVQDSHIKKLYINLERYEQIIVKSTGQSDKLIKLIERVLKK